ncbi:hypothetical protein Drose_31865 [Dactylosporangium roseum]|uniref:Streptomyces killer toxin-like beta/gamma crystallin domain-containing protein n=1 Tax=Dactylosporangium roseum TaxID=47989 RepID=A0ABY5Z0W2_9ACTN|nr:hypothetical protein [Dactylosporangium roseum]UWZ35660.1 hypothetical protein Drose_31865 [Dactylosporangium roseum]
MRKRPLLAGSTRTRRMLTSAVIGTAVVLGTTGVPAQAASACVGSGIDRVGGTYTEVSSNCIVVGSSHTTVMYEVFGDRLHPNQRAVVEVYGIEHGKSTWYSLGTIAPGPSILYTVPWGKHTGTPKIRITATSAGGATIAKIIFNH